MATSSDDAGELLRLVTAGSVDDGKSTLIGRLLYDTKQILADQLEHIEETSLRRGDGVRQPRAAHRRPPRRARAGDHDRRRLPLVRDAAPPLPARRRAGHVQYTRNMVTGASTADVAVILLDARKGVVEQTRRHSYIAAMLAIPHVVVAVNKMDLVDFSAERFAEIEADLAGALEPARARTTSGRSRCRRSAATTSSTAATRCPGTTGRRCSSTSRRSSSPATATSTTGASPCSG